MATEPAGGQGIDWSTLAAWYGAGLSTLVAGFSWWNGRARLRVELSERRVDPFPMLIVTAKNVGSKTIVLDAPPVVRFARLAPKGGPHPLQAALIQHGNVSEYPHALEPGHSCAGWVPVKTLAQTILRRDETEGVRIVGEFTDRLGKRYRSQAMRASLMKWMNLPGPLERS